MPVPAENYEQAKNYWRNKRRKSTHKQQQRSDMTTAEKNEMDEMDENKDEMFKIREITGRENSRHDG